MELNKTLFEDNNIKVVDEQLAIEVIAGIHNKTDKDIIIKFGNNGIDDIKLEADSWQDLFDEFEDFKALALLVKGCFTVEIVERKNELKDMQVFNEEIVRIVKKAINDNAFVCGERELVFMFSNEFDHIAEDVADNVCKLIAKGE